jgi:uncharacterized tellurite resistance protein B-like protein
MFLHLFNEDQQKAFLVLAKRFVESDSTLSDEEHNLVELLYAETGLPFETELPEADNETLLQAFDGRQARAAVLLELIGAGHADREFHPEENAFIKKVAGTFQVSDDRLREMEDWIERQVALARDVEKFWSE